MNLVFFLEEPSAREMLKGLLKHLLAPGINPRYIVFEGKRDLERRLVKRLRGWRLPESRFVILCDQDSADCRKVKESLVRKCQEAGEDKAIVRIACRELESWYLGDLTAVEAGLGMKNLARLQGKRKYRNPDSLGNPVEELEKLTGKTYQKVAGSRAIGPHLSLSGNRSRSFSVFVCALKRMAIQE